MSANSFMEEIERLKKKFDQAVSTITNIDDAEAIRVQFIGRKGALADLFKKMAELKPEERKTAGQQLNYLKEYFQNTIEENLNSV